MKKLPPKNMIKWILLLPAISIFSCAKPIVETDKTVDTLAVKSTCPVIESGKWHAWLDKFQQKKGSYRLNVSGEIVLPNPAYNISWEEGPTDRMAPPGLRIFLEPIAQEVMAIQMISTKAVEYKQVTPIKHYRYVAVYCGGKLLGQMNNVMLTD